MRGADARPSCAEFVGEHGGGTISALGLQNEVRGQGRLRSAAAGIEEARSQAAHAGGPPGGLPPRTPPERRVQVMLIAGVAFAGLLAVGVTLMMATPLPVPTTSELAATLDGDAPRQEGPTFLGRLMGAAGGGASASTEPPVAFLPPPPSGWVRVTPRDAADPDVMARVAARWTAAGGSATPLDRHPGYRELVRLIDTFDNPDTEGRVLARKSTRAIYLHPQGHVLHVALEFRDKVRALGPKDDPASRTAAVAEQQEKARTPNEVIEQTRLAGVAVINRTRPSGGSMVARPIGGNLDAPNGFRLALALTDRAVMEMQGVAPPRAAATMIAAMDRQALAARLD